jgi:hypothetical protein
VKNCNLTKFLLAALLVASPLAGAESQYPAAGFQPTVLFQDADYIAKHGKSITTEAAPAGAEVAPAGAKSENPLTENLPILVVVLALVGWAFFSAKKAGSKAQAIQSRATAFVATGETAAETGVARYMKNLDISAGGAAAETGVARYVKNLEQSGTATRAETGVARYVRNLS